MSYLVKIQGTEHILDVAPGESVLDAALKAGFVIPHSCRGGSCGACEGQVLDGNIAYPTPPPALDKVDINNGQALFCQARPLTDLTIAVNEIRRADDIVPRVLPARVAALDRLADDVMRVRLQLPKSEKLRFLAGQYLDILLPDGRRRSFSIANAPHDEQFLELHIRHVPNGSYTTHVFENMREKEILRIEAPLGTFYLREASERPMLMMAGGTGFGPIKALIEHATAIGDTRPIHLYWGARAKADLYQHDLVQTWLDARQNFQYTPVLSEPAADDNWAGKTGWVHEVLAADYPNLGDHDVYLCGPPPMIDGAKAQFTAQGLPTSQLYFDSFEFAAS